MMLPSFSNKFLSGPDGQLAVGGCRCLCNLVSLVAQSKPNKSGVGHQPGHLHDKLVHLGEEHTLSSDFPFYLKERGELGTWWVGKKKAEEKEKSAARTSFYFDFFLHPVL